MLAAAALGRDAEPARLTADDGMTLHAVSGEILDVSPHLIIVEDDEGVERRLVIAPWATAWHGEPVPPADLPIGAHVVIRALRAGTVVERIWANITRMTGIILSVTGRQDLTVELDAGPHRGRRTIVIPYRSSGRIRVRHPQLEPGYLFDAIGLMDGGAATACIPATSQPPYRAKAVPPSPPAYRGVQSKISGAAAWADFPEHGVTYPMLEEADAGCGMTGVSCAGLPYLAIGSTLFVRNVCDGRANALPIVGCGCIAGRFCDRCLECGTSPRGRLVELSATAYVELGGDLVKGCFNARVGLG
ncbi:hypothetical protein Pth03_46490 [Planotetraspora thailandica]|uniref:Uncharacterized protein n=2 Tax=Planotetraspora thailandica TaxID=487172 RepID=A0A8J3V548_9ACTN|nr:hypothetical protein [Planotetraspora thailandica]GII56260.1 hypothetical protein Pth03_46490 [Planotetraspora thailandica]